MAEENHKQHHGHGNSENNMPEHMEHETAEHMEHETAEHMEHNTAEHMEHNTAEHMEHETAEHMEHNTAEHMEHETAEHMEHNTAEHMEHNTAEHMEHDAAGHSEHMHSGGAHDKHTGHSPKMFWTRFWVCLILTIPALVFSHQIQEIFGYSFSFSGSEYISAFFGTIIFIYGGLVFIKGAKNELMNKTPGMMTLITLAITVAFLYSLAVTFGIVDGMDLWWELATLITIMLFGHWLEMVSVVRAKGSLDDLAKLLPDTAEVTDGSGTQTQTRTVPLSQLKPGDFILVRPGAKIPADGIVVSGKSDVNESMLTGESRPVQKQKDSKVIAGTQNGSGTLTFSVTDTGDGTVLFGMMKLVKEASESKSKSQVLADKAAFGLTILAVAAAVVTFIYWTFFTNQPIDFVLERVVTVLVIACPHALGLAIPLVVAISTTMAAKNGFLIRDQTALENVHKTNVFLFDKTGTLTIGKQGVSDIITADGFDKEQVLSWASAVEAGSEHPIAAAIMDAAKEKNITPAKAENFSALAGRGAVADVDGKTIYVGGPALAAELNAELPESIRAAEEKAAAESKTIVFVMEKENGKTKITGTILLSDTVRPESAEAVKKLQEMDKEVMVLSGDSKSVVKSVSDELGISKYYAEVLPEKKTDVVRELQNEHKKVTMVGDGVNDAPALMSVDVGIAIGAGTDIAIDSAGIILINNDPRGVPKVVKLSKATYRKMLENLFWASAYNVVMIPLAAGLSVYFGFVISPAWGAVLMTASTVIVAINAQFLRRKKLD
ncbi:Copper-exporting P-type ATPase B [Methanosarcinaceae archaeon Ag5]|uniref:Copper-exporting P-type ATPase B n=1 Tax=Methanolapillus africanus TaxID=3028297 RepID=A0AAE4ML63_9EURY|nr:Copper-exporting P-type ATPase B [Methanosarcinaceae archaeon Ag5]